MGNTGNVKDKDGADRIFEVAGYETAISFLASRIPKLQAAGSGMMRHIFAEKVDADGGLHACGVTLSFSSKRLLTKRYMMLVLPVLVSPSRMVLKVRLPTEEEVIDI
jgi:hypothetical protein